MHLAFLCKGMLELSILQKESLYFWLQYNIGVIFILPLPCR